MKYNLVIVSMFKNESIILKEWIEHHIKWGVDHFFLINNGSTDTSDQVLTPYLKYITYVSDASCIFSPTIKEITVWDKNTQNTITKSHHVTFQQYLVNHHFLKPVKTSSQWVAFIDCDEYLYTHTPKITGILSKLPTNTTRVFIPWKNFGSNGHVDQPPSIRKGFLLRNKDPVCTGNYWGYGKSIEKVSEISYLCPHRSELFTDHTVLPNLEPLTSDTIKQFSYDRNNIIYCNHYITMSRYYYEHFKSKRTGGSTNIIRQNSNYWERNDNKPDDVYDNILANLT